MRAAATGVPQRRAVRPTAAQRPAHPLAALQRHAGNRAVAALVQRHGVGPATPVDEATATGPLTPTGAGPIANGPDAAGACSPKTKEVPPPAPTSAALSDAEVAGAIAYYRSQPQRYPQTTMTQLQTAVGAPATGVADRATVEAVARAQLRNTELPRLKPDGKAGPRTLPRLFRQGLNEGREVAAFAADVTAIKGTWASVTTPAGRARRLGTAANARLVDSQVLPPTTSIARLDGCAVGQFQYPTWTIELNEGAFALPNPTSAQVDGLANTVYHEARHCQQWFQMARHLAGLHLSVSGIRGRMQIPEAPAVAARARPLAPGSVEFALASEWFEAWYGEGAQAQYGALVAEATAAIQALKRAEAAFARSPTETNRRRVEEAAARRDRAMQRYRDHGVEDDAHATAGAVDTALLTPATP